MSRGEGGGEGGGDVADHKNLTTLTWQVEKNVKNCQWLFLVPLKGGRWHIIPQLAVYTTYILPFGGLYATYHPLQESEKSIEIAPPPSLTNHPLRSPNILQIPQHRRLKVIKFQDGLGRFFIGNLFGRKRPKKCQRLTADGWFQYQNCSQIFRFWAHTPLKTNMIFWKIPMFNRKYIFKWWMFYCHASFPGCIYNHKTWKKNTLTSYGVWCSFTTPKKNEKHTFLCELESFVAPSNFVGYQKSKIHWNHQDYSSHSHGSWTMGSPKTCFLIGSFSTSMIMGGRVDLNDPAKLNLKRRFGCVCAFQVASRNSWLDSE